MFKQQNEIKFFEEEVEETYMDRPPHDGSHTACGTPNPPWWCNENATSIDMYLLVLVVAAILIKLNFKNENKKI